MKTPAMKAPALMLALPLLLAGCINDGASCPIEGKDHSISLLREQPLMWSKKINFSVVVSRMPKCMRRFDLQAGTAGSKAELWQTGPNDFILRTSKKSYALETETCAEFKALDSEPAEGMGQLLGTFAEKKGKFIFIAEEKPTEPAETGTPADEPAR